MVLGSVGCPKGACCAVQPPDRHAAQVLVLRFTAVILHGQVWDINHCQVGRQPGCCGGRAYCQVKVLMYLPGMSCS